MSTSPTTPTSGADLVTRLLDLWSRPLPPDDTAALAGFGELYTDPVEVNGTSVSLADMLVRARAIQGAFSGLERVVLEQVEAPGKVVVAFRLVGTHTGPLPTALGVVPATGGAVDLRVIDVLTLTDGRISRIVMAGDELGNLVRLGAVALADAT
ncbi:ester cyclase [Actinomycetospora callitridis]|uniref:ester cyclase n=1 Tax=Actinomycetospora callitridis TaxID=913944 RepID=UPI002365768A|nr:ester cyclase [Actinomycetospora callitridis]MDD7919740.1 ester cyclase [Actinomycetospora callitridis]